MDGQIQKEIEILYPDAFSSKENLVKTLGHERIHIYQQKFLGSPKTMRCYSNFEKGHWFRRLMVGVL